MRFLADENIPARLVKALRDAGADVFWIKTQSPGLDDDGVWALTISDGRVLLTFDKDFGDHARGKPMPPECGVVLLRVPMPKPEEMNAITKIILGRSDWAGRFSVVEPGRVRTRVLNSDH